MTQDNRSEFEKRLDEKAFTHFGFNTGIGPDSYRDGYSECLTDPLVEAMERALEELAAKYCDAKPGCKVQFAHDALDAYRAAKAKVK